MLRAYGPGCDGSVVEAHLEKIPEDATWIDLEEPTNAIVADIASSADKIVDEVLRHLNP